MEKEASNKEEINPTLKFMLDNRIVVNVLIYLFGISVAISIPILIWNKWISQELAVNVILMVIGSFLGGGLFKYANRR